MKSIIAITIVLFLSGCAKTKPRVSVQSHGSVIVGAPRTESWIFIHGSGLTLQDGESKCEIDKLMDGEIILATPGQTFAGCFALETKIRNDNDVTLAHFPEWWVKKGYGRYGGMLHPRKLLGRA